MKKIQSIFTLSLLTLGLLSCNREAAPVKGTEGDGESSFTIALSLGGEPKTKGVEQTSAEMRIASIDAFVYNADGLLERHKRVTGDGITECTDMKVRYGEKHVYIYCNYPESLLDVSALNLESSMNGVRAAYVENARNAFVMKGTKTHTVSTPTSSVTVNVRRDVSKVEIASAPIFSGNAAGSTLEGIYLINVPKTYNESVVLTASSASDAWNFRNTAKTGAESAVAAMTYDSSWSTALYGMPNATPQATLDANGYQHEEDFVTKLVLKTSLGGETFWYPISIPDMKPNYYYKVSTIIVNNKGVENPNDYVEVGVITATLNVLDWNEEFISGNYTDGSVEVYGPLTFKALDDYGVITWKCGKPSAARTIKYRKNGGDWNEITSSTTGVDIEVYSDDIVEFWGDNTEYCDMSYGDDILPEQAYSYFDGNITCEIYGDLQSLMNYRREITSPYAYAGLFSNSNCASPTNKLILSATTVSEHCYEEMFSNSPSVQHAPAILATTLAPYCFGCMFENCIWLTDAPELPATTLAQGCYKNMFYGCTQLKSAPSLPATTLENNCYSNMFYNCRNITTAPELPATTLARECYYQMFYGCTKLENAPELPATTLANNAYYRMFYGCTKLTNAPELPATTLAPNCYQAMFYNCTSLTTAPELPATTLEQTCYRQMFQGCSSLTTAPVLPAEVLVTDCYRSMFNGCTSLTYIKCLAKGYTSSSSGCPTDNWVSNTKPGGTFVCDATSNWTNDMGRNGAPAGWTIVTE